VTTTNASLNTNLHSLLRREFEYYLIRLTFADKQDHTEMNRQNENETLHRFIRAFNEITRFRSLSNIEFMLIDKRIDVQRQKTNVMFECDVFSSLLLLICSRITISSRH
jgi:hypothetical protein